MDISSIALPGYSGPVRIAGLLLIISALALGIYGINRSLWTDEAWVANSVLSPSLSGMFYYPSWLQTTPPLFLLLTRAVVDLFGPSSVVFRIVPLVLELVAVGCMAAVSSRLLSFPFALLASALMAFHPTAIEYSRTCKQYSGEMAASTVILLCTVLYLGNPVRRRFYWLIGAIVVALPLAWSSVFLLPGVAIAVFARGGLRRASLLALGSGGVLLVLYLGFIRQNLSPELRAFWMESAQRLSPGLLAVVILCVVAGVQFLWTREWMQLVALLPCLLLAMADALHWYPVSQRTRLFALPCFLLVAAMMAQELFDWLTRRRLSPRLVGALAGLIVIIIGSEAAWRQIRQHQNLPIEDFAGTLEHLRQRVAPSDVLLVHASVIEGFQLYNEIDDWRRRAIYGETGWPCCRRGLAPTHNASSEEAVANDLRRMVPPGFSGRIWMLYSARHTHWLWTGLDEGRLWRSILAERGCTPGNDRDLANLSINEMDCVNVR